MDDALVHRDLLLFVQRDNPAFAHTERGHARAQSGPPPQRRVFPSLMLHVTCTSS